MRRVCRRCGCVLHMASTITGAGYWASNSGRSVCPWPNGHTFHDPVLTGED